MSLLSTKINFFKTIKNFNIFQYILTHGTIMNEIFKFGNYFNCRYSVEPTYRKKNCNDVPKVLESTWNSSMLFQCFGKQHWKTALFTLHLSKVLGFHFFLKSYNML